MTPRELMQAADEAGVTLALWKGQLIVQTDRGGSMARLDSTTGIMGDADRVHETVGHWRLELGGSEEIAAKAWQFSASYDNWFLALRPLEKLDRPTYVVRMEA